MLYTGQGVVVVPNSASTAGKVGWWLMCVADATVNVTFFDGTSITAMPMKAGQLLPIDIKFASNASVANAIYAVRPKG